jgi:hypothetical protein
MAAHQNATLCRLRGPSIAAPTPPDHTAWLCTPHRCWLHT